MARSEVTGRRMIEARHGETLYPHGEHHFFSIQQTDVKFLHNAHIFDEEQNILCIIKSGTRGRAVDAARNYIDKLEDNPKDALYKWLSQT